MSPRFLSIALMLAPGIALAAPLTYKELVNKIAGFLQAALGIIFWIIFFYVAWTLVQTWSLHGDKSDAVTKGSNTLLAGIIGLTVLVSLWGILAFARSLLV